MVKLDLKLTCTISHGVLSQTIEPEPSSFIKGYGTILCQIGVDTLISKSRNKCSVKLMEGNEFLSRVTIF